MSKNEERKSGSSAQGGDTEESLANELEKESAEGKDSVGDVKSNRNLSGASSWDTLPDEETKSGSNASKDSGKKSS
jgi:hypothetical protein